MAITKLFNSNTIISLHPSAKDAYLWINRYPFLFNFNALSGTLQDILSREMLLTVINDTREAKKHKKQKHLYVYAPLWPILFWQNNQPPIGTVLVQSGPLSDEEIERAAWLSVLTPLFLSIDASKLSEIRESLCDHMPEHLQDPLFSTSKISDKQLCSWTGVSRGTLVQQRQKHRQKSPAPPSTEDVIAILSQPWEKNDAK